MFNVSTRTTAPGRFSMTGRPTTLAIGLGSG
jgi:hypothetical protein